MELATLTALSERGREKGRQRERGWEGRINRIHRPWVIQSNCNNALCEVYLSKFDHTASNLTLSFLKLCSESQNSEEDKRILRSSDASVKQYCEFTLWPLLPVPLNNEVPSCFVS